MPITPQDYNNDATKGSQLQRLMANEIRDRIKGDIPNVIARALVDLDRRLESLESDDQDLGNVHADLLDAQVLRVGGIDVKTKQSAKSSPSASGTDIAFIDTVSQNENGEITATRKTVRPASTSQTGVVQLDNTLSGGSTTKVPTTKTVKDAIDNVSQTISSLVKGSSDVAGMGNDDTHVYTGMAVSTAISEAVTGEVGGYLGEKTVSQMNAYTSPKMGDNALVTNTGTITVGSVSCIITEAPSEVRWTTSGSWEVTSVGYVRDTKVATTSSLGLVKTNASSGGVSLNNNNQMVVNGWNGKQDSLPTNTTPSDTYSINVDGSATSITKTSLGQVNTLPVASMVSSGLKAGTFLLKATSDGGSPYVFGDVTIPNGQWYRFVVSGESSNYCTITLDVIAGGSSTPFGTFKLLVDNGSVKKVVRVPYETTTSAVGGSSTPIYVDSNGEFKECDQIPSASTSTPASIATTGSAGSSTSWSKGDHVHPISLAAGDTPGFVKIAGQNVPVTGLNWCASENRFVFNINGSATSIANNTPTFYATDSLFVPIGQYPPTGYASWNDVFDAVLNRLANKGRVYAIDGGNVSGGSGYTFEKYIPATYIYIDDNDPKVVLFSEVLDSLYDTSQVKNHGIIRTYQLTPTGWTSTPDDQWPAYAERAIADADGNSLQLAITNNEVTSIGGKVLHAATAASATSASSALTDGNGVSITIGTTSGRVTSIGGKTLQSERSTYDGVGNNIVDTYAPKQIFVNLGNISSSISLSQSTSWKEIYDHGDTASFASGKWHVYMLNLSLYGVVLQSQASANAMFAITTDGNTPANDNSNVVALPMAVVRHNDVGGQSLFLAVPFVITSLSFRPSIWLKFSEAAGGSSGTPITVSGSHFYYSIST